MRAFTYSEKVSLTSSDRVVKAFVHAFEHVSVEDGHTLSWVDRDSETPLLQVKPSERWGLVLGQGANAILQLIMRSTTGKSI